MRKEIAELRARFDEAAASETTREKKRRREPIGTAASLLPPAGIFLAKPQTSHTFIGSSTVMLTLQVPARDGKSPHTCVVVVPGGDRLAKTVQPPAIVLSGLGPINYSVWFPDQFLGSEPLEPGLYQVEWRRGSVLDQVAEPGTTALLAQLMTLNTMALVASDSFTIPDRRPAQGSGQQ